jgi:drug/metabolite transporter (DMT)-like permease
MKEGCAPGRCAVGLSGLFALLYDPRSGRRHQPASRHVLIPVSAVLLGVLVLGETLLTRQLAGMALIACGLACTDGRLPSASLAPERHVAPVQS